MGNGIKRSKIGRKTIKFGVIFGPKGKRQKTRRYSLDLTDTGVWSMELKFKNTSGDKGKPAKAGGEDRSKNGLFSSEKSEGLCGVRRRGKVRSFLTGMRWWRLVAR